MPALMPARRCSCSLHPAGDKAVPVCEAMPRANVCLAGVMRSTTNAALFCWARLSGRTVSPSSRPGSRLRQKSSGRTSRVPGAGESGLENGTGAAEYAGSAHRQSRKKKTPAHRQRSRRGRVGKTAGSRFEDEVLYVKPELPL